MAQLTPRTAQYGQMRRMARPARLATAFLYDTVQLTASIAAGQTRMFSVPRGSTGSGFSSAKTLLQTNLQEGNRLPNERSFEVHRLGMLLSVHQRSAYVAGTLLDMENILTHHVLIYESGDYSRVLGRCDMFPGGGGLVASGAIATTATTTTTQIAHGTNGVAGVFAEVRLPEPLILVNGQQFNIVLDHPQAYTMAASSQLYWLTCKLFGAQVTVAPQ